jgi:hypothetical protein
MNRYVKAMNKKSNVPQILTLKTWENIQSKLPKLAKNLTFVCECDDKGNKIEEVVDGRPFEEEELKNNKELEEKEKADAEAEEERIRLEEEAGLKNDETINTENNGESKEQPQENESLSGGETAEQTGAEQHEEGGGGSEEQPQ